MKLTPEQALEILFATVIFGSLGWLGTEMFELNGRLNKLEGRLDTIVEIRGDVQNLEAKFGTLQATLGIPSILITETPPPTQDLSSKGTIGGRVEGVEEPQEHRVVIYALTDKWYVQPTATEPLTTIDLDGSWRTRTHSGSSYAALLVEGPYEPPLVVDALPEVKDEILASVERKQSKKR